MLGDNKLEDVLEKLRDFRDERDWKQFHNLKDLATAAAIESAELQEIFLWQKAENIEEFSARHRKEIKFEIADMLTYLFFLCLAMDLDPIEAVLEKLEISKEKYPVKKSNGVHSNKYT